MQANTIKKTVLIKEQFKKIRSKGRCLSQNISGFGNILHKRTKKQAENGELSGKTAFYSFFGKRRKNRVKPWISSPISVESRGVFRFYLGWCCSKIYHVSQLISERWNRFRKNQCQNRKGKYKMTGKELENNQVTIIGEVVSGFTYNHEIYGEGFYMVDLSVERLSNSHDIIPVMISERLIDVNQDYMGCYLEVQGQFRSYNRHDERKNRLLLSVFAREARFIDLNGDIMPGSSQTNHIYLDGYICKEPVYRKTPLGREITDLLLAVNRPYGKSDYIPCISWGRNARFAGNFKVGDRVNIWGRIQSREYVKRLDEDTMEKRIAYEVSIGKLETVEEEIYQPY